MKRTILVLSAIVVSTLYVSSTAQAQTTPCGYPTAYSGTCYEAKTASSYNTITANSTAGVAVTANDSSSGYGVFASSNSGIGIWGSSDSSDGIYAISTSGYGIYAVTNGDSTSAAAGYFTTGAGTSSTAVAAVNTSSGTGLYASSGLDGWAGYFSGDVDVTGEITVGSCSGCASDLRLKKNVKPLGSALDSLLQLRGVTFEWIDPTAHQHEAGHGEGTQTGFIAQDVEKVFPNWVKQDGYTARDGEKYKTLELRQIEALEVESLRELRVQNDDLRGRLEANEARTAKLEDRLNALQSGRDPITGGVGVGRGTLLFVGLGLAGAFGLSRRKRADQKS